MKSPEVFYLHIQGEQRGPYSIEHIDHLLNSGLITIDAMFWREGLEQWQPVTELVTLRRAKSKLKLPLYLLGILGVLGFFAYVFGPITLDGWREIYQHEYTANAAYWRGRDVVRNHLSEKGALVVFASFVADDVQMLDPNKASVLVKGRVTHPDGQAQEHTWKVDLIFNAETREWSAVEAKELVRP